MRNCFLLSHSQRKKGLLQNVELCIGRKKKRGFAAVKLQPRTLKFHIIPPSIQPNAWTPMLFTVFGMVTFLMEQPLNAL